MKPCSPRAFDQNQKLGEFDGLMYRTYWDDCWDDAMTLSSGMRHENTEVVILIASHMMMPDQFSNKLTD